MAWWLATVSRELSTAQRCAEAGYEPALFLSERAVVKRNVYLPREIYPVFPNYLFVRTSGSANDLMCVKGVAGFVRSTEDEIAEVGDDVVDDLISRSTKALLDWQWILGESRADQVYQVGDFVEVTRDNAWFGTKARVEVACDGYLTLVMDLMGRRCPIVLREVDVSLVSRPDDVVPTKRRRHRRARNQHSDLVAQ